MIRHILRNLQKAFFLSSAVLMLLALERLKTFELHPPVTRNDLGGVPPGPPALMMQQQQQQQQQHDDELDDTTSILSGADIVGDDKPIFFGRPLFKIGLFQFVIPRLEQTMPDTIHHPTTTTTTTTRSSTSSSSRNQLRNGGSIIRKESSVSRSNDDVGLGQSNKKQPKITSDVINTARSSPSLDQVDETKMVSGTRDDMRPSSPHLSQERTQRILFVIHLEVEDEGDDDEDSCRADEKSVDDLIRSIAVLHQSWEALWKRSGRNSVVSSSSAMDNVVFEAHWTVLLSPKTTASDSNENKQSHDVEPTAAVSRTSASGSLSSSSSLSSCQQHLKASEMLSKRRIRVMRPEVTTTSSCWLDQVMNAFVPSSALERFEWIVKIPTAASLFMITQEQHLSITSKKVGNNDKDKNHHVRRLARTATATSRRLGGSLMEQRRVVALNKGRRLSTTPRTESTKDSVDQSKAVSSQNSQLVLLEWVHSTSRTATATLTCKDMVTEHHPQHASQDDTPKHQLPFLPSWMEWYTFDRTTTMTTDTDKDGTRSMCLHPQNDVRMLPDSSKTHTKADDASTTLSSASVAPTAQCEYAQRYWKELLSANV